MKRILFAIAAAVLFFNTLVVPAPAHADGGTGSTNCGGNGQMCKP